MADGMRCMILAAGFSPALAMFVSAGFAEAAAIGQTDRAAICAMITGQIAAFRADDAGTAYSFAAPGIKANFPDAKTFVAMVKRHYRTVYRP